MFAFALWDIWYYVWLKVLVDWPKTLLDWDTLFRIPVPWLGPVLSPMLTAILICVVAVLTVYRENRQEMPKITLFQVGVVLCGALLALYVFMSGAIQAWIKGGTSWRSAQPEVFNWPLFRLALLLMSDPPFIAQAQGHAKGESPGSGYLDSSLQRFQKDYVSRSRHAIHTFPAFHKMEALIAAGGRPGRRSL